MCRLSQKSLHQKTFKTKLKSSTMEITLADLEKWKQNSLDTARAMNLCEKIVLTCLDSATLSLEDCCPDGVLYGAADYWSLDISVYSDNPSTKMLSQSDLSLFLEQEGFEKERVGKLLSLFEQVPSGTLFEIYNQSGMDHELLGHLGNSYSDRPSGEFEACKTQVEMANYRAREDKNWAIISKILPEILQNHKRLSQSFTQ